MRKAYVPIIFILLLFILLWIQGSYLGLSDDEAYYWVLGQKPALGYAYHPPAVAWMIYLIQNTVGCFFSSPSPSLLRLPAALTLSVLFGLALSWLRRSGQFSIQSVFILITFYPLFGLAWMMVPDIPLFLFWMILFFSTDCVIFPNRIEKSLIRTYSFNILLFISSAGLVLSKYSGILAIFSSFCCLVIFGGFKKNKNQIGLLVLGSIVGLIPSLIWNAQHEWGSLLYQIKDRHSGSSVSWIRYFRFWIIQLVLFGPALFLFFIALMKKKNWYQNQKNKILLIWILPPALVYFIQPLFSEFKPHWTLIVGWPIVMGLALNSSFLKLKKFHIIYGSVLGALLIVSSHLPILSWILKTVKPAQFQTLWDVTNDFYGWSVLRSYAMNLPDKNIPWAGSRYQTASQTAFYLQGLSTVTLYPSDLKSKDEWPEVQFISSDGKLNQPIYFVIDQRYSSPPPFSEEECKKEVRLENFRFGIQGKWIEVWKCKPTKS